MRTLVTGAGGYLGSALTAALTGTRARTVSTACAARGGASEHGLAAADELVLTDRTIAATRADDAAPPAARPKEVAGDIGNAVLQDALFAQPVDSLFHLAGVVSGAAEADFEAGKHINLDATLALLERCRRQRLAGGPLVRFVYASSIAVYGTPLPPRIDDDTPPSPTLSYGTHKRACELLIDDYSRRGYVDGRCLRLSGVVVRPPLANGALSGFNSDLLREPLAGRRYVCPVSAEATIWITSLHHATGNLRRLHDADGAALGARRTVTTPSLAVSIADVVAAIARVDAAAARGVSYRPDPALEAQFGRWPRHCSFARAEALGLTTDRSIDAVIQTHLESL